MLPDLPALQLGNVLPSGPGSATCDGLPGHGGTGSRFCPLRYPSLTPSEEGIANVLIESWGTEVFTFQIVSVPFHPGWWTFCQYNSFKNDVIFLRN